MNLGTALIKQVVEALRLDLPQLRRFVTLSPIPGFRSWLEGELRSEGANLRDRERELLPAEPARVLARLADAEWDVDEAIRPALLALCARYLTTAPEGRAADPVANFHLANGAVGGARQLDGRCVTDRPGPLVRRDGQLPLRARSHPRAGRGVRDTR